VYQSGRRMRSQENMWIKLDGYMRGKFDN